MTLKDKVVLITGGSGALGHTVVPAFVEAGARVVMVSDKPEAAPSDVSIMRADLTDQTAVQRVVTEIIGKTGRIDGLINLVGGFASGRVTETDVTLWRRMLDINVTVAFLLSKVVASHMQERRIGRIVHMAAWAAVEPFPGAAAYIVSKSSLLTLVRVLALELSGSGVTVNAVLPTTLDTAANRVAMPEADRSTWASPDAIAKTLIFLTSDGAGQISGAAIPVSGRGGVHPTS
ncbi:MAG TPA: SDR family NAD(P)-dependent oxidoreductase [Nitrospira sp.]|nr:SDR family NAD(P)-dependent oxidoreductase [Nitrospira sp.]